MMEKRKHQPPLRGESGTVAEEKVEQQVSGALNKTRPLTSNLMEKVCDSANLNLAYKRVKSNKGAPGVDGLTVDEMGAYIRQHKDNIIQSLIEGSYQPQPVRGVKIPKPGKGGGFRQLGVPTTIDRLVEQAIHQVIEPLYDPQFSDTSYGFRTGKSAHQALDKACEYVTQGRRWVVDIDLEKFFDRVNHDILMSRLSRKIEDRRLLKVIRRFLEAGMMQDGVCTRRCEGAPQGSPLSPLLSNILLDDLDKELDKRGHAYCRYCDDCNIYVKSRKAGERVMTSIKQLLEKRLKLKLNEEKSAVALVDERKFLGYTLRTDGRLALAKESLGRLKEKVRFITKRNRSRELATVMKELKIYLIGWLSYFRKAVCRSTLANLDSWIRRKLRCYRLKQRKKRGPIFRFLIELGLQRQDAWKVAMSGKGWWHKSLSRPIHKAMSNQWFEEQGFPSLVKRYDLLNA